MNILVTGANGQLGNEMRIVSKNSQDKYIFTDIVEVEGLETTILDITNLDSIREMVKQNDVRAWYWFLRGKQLFALPLFRYWTISGRV